MSEQSLKRSNRVTAYWGGDGVAVGVYYRTHDKLLEKKSSDPDVAAAGFKMPEGTEENPVTAQDKLAAFKTFLQVNAAQFGIQYDPVDRRAEEFKFPNKYDEATFTEYSKTMAERSIGETLEKVQKNVIGNLVKSDNLPEGSEINFAIGDGTISIKEAYANGNIKYADAVYPVVLQLGDKDPVQTTCTVSAVSGQLKKPRELADCVLTQTGVKEFLIGKGVLPKVEKPAKEEKSEAASTADGAPVENGQAPVENEGQTPADGDAPKRQRKAKSTAPQEMATADGAPV